MRVSQQAVKDAAKRLHQLDSEDVGGRALCLAIGGGYGQAKRMQVISDIRTLVEHASPQLGSPFPPPPFDVA